MKENRRRKIQSNIDIIFSNESYYEEVRREERRELTRRSEGNASLGRTYPPPPVAEAS